MTGETSSRLIGVGHETDVFNVRTNDRKLTGNNRDFVSPKMRFIDSHYDTDVRNVGV